jgi:hypothetical protein
MKDEGQYKLKGRGLSTEAFSDSMPWRLITAYSVIGHTKFSAALLEAAQMNPSTYKITFNYYENELHITIKTAVICIYAWLNKNKVTFREKIKILKAVYLKLTAIRR